jgi:hypothetical protein
MPPSSISADVRGTLATALSSVAGSVYSYVPEAIIPPAVVIVPSSPYMEPNLINKATVKVMLNYKITAAVAYNSNPASLDNLEKLIISILAVIPAGYVLGQIETPQIVQVGASNVLSADINVSTYYTQTN